MDNKAFLSLWNMEQMPACEEGMRLAELFLLSCGAAVDRFGEEEPADRISDITDRYNALVEHGNLCDDCNEV